MTSRSRRRRSSRRPKDSFATVGRIAGNLIDDDDTIGFRHREWVLEDGARGYVLGEAPDAEGELLVISLVQALA